MAVGLKVKYYWYEIGSSSFFYSFFSTIAYRLENKKWGNKYPHVMNKLYRGKLECDDIDEVIMELNDIKSGLSKYKPNKVIWDFDDLNKMPPWGNNISSDITNLSNYFVTSDGNDLFEVIYSALNKAKELGCSLEISSLQRSRGGNCYVKRI